MKSTDPLRSVKADSLLALVLETGGCWLPPDEAGAFSVKVWCVLLGNREERTVRKWIADNSIPATLAGHEQLVEVRDMRRFLPRVNASAVEG